MVNMEDGFKNEEHARQLVQKELAVMMDEIKNPKMSSGSVVSAAKPVQVWDWGLELLLDHRFFRLDGMIHSSCQERWNSKVESRIEEKE